MIYVSSSLYRQIREQVREPRTRPFVSKIIRRYVCRYHALRAAIVTLIESANCTRRRRIKARKTARSLPMRVTMIGPGTTLRRKRLKCDDGCVNFRVASFGMDTLALSNLLPCLAW